MSLLNKTPVLQVQDYFPGSPYDGETFVHALAGRKIEYSYNSLTGLWTPKQGFGDITIYVDQTDGTDDLNHGYGLNANAFASITYAWLSLPPTITGNARIYINNEVYAESPYLYGGPCPQGGDYRVRFIGSSTTNRSGAAAAGSVQGGGAVQGTFVDGIGGMVVNAYRNMFLKVTSGVCNGEVYVIDSNTANTFTICGAWLGGAPGAGDTYDVIVPATQWTPNGVGIIVRQTNVVVQFHGIEFAGIAGFDIDCTISPLTLAIINCINNGWVVSEALSSVLYQDSLADYSGGGAMRLSAYANSYMEIVRGKVINVQAFTPGVYCSVGSCIFIDGGFVMDGLNPANNSGGVYCRFNSTVNCDNDTWGALWGFVRIRNYNIGVSAIEVASVEGTTNNQYAGNNTNESPTPASYGYVD